MQKSLDSGSGENNGFEENEFVVPKKKRRWWIRYALLRSYSEKRTKIKPKGYKLPDPSPLTRGLSFLATAIILTFVARLVFMAAPRFPEWTYYAASILVSLIAIAFPATTLQTLSLVFQIPLGILWLIEWSLSLFLIAGLCFIQILLPLLLWIALGAGFIVMGQVLLGSLGVAIGLIGFIAILWAIGKKTLQIIADTVSATWNEGWDIADTLKNWYLPYPDRITPQIRREASKMHTTHPNGQICQI